MENRCPDCRADAGDPHEYGCDVARCPKCKMQLSGCGCIEGLWSKSIWTGRWPGEAECEALGWYARLIPGKPGWHVCLKEDEGAQANLNRWVVAVSEGGFTPEDVKKLEEAGFKMEDVLPVGVGANSVRVAIPTNSAYLGDAIYVTKAEYHLVLTLDHHDPEQATTVIYLDDDVLAEFDAFRTQLAQQTAEQID